MRRLASIVIAFLAVSSGAASAPSPLPGARVLRACAGAGPFWPTQTLALTRGTAWVACKEQGRVVRVALRTGGVRAVGLNGQPIAVVAAFDAVWALDSAGTIARIDSGTTRVTARIATGTSRPYNLWAGAGSLWTADDATGEIVRVNPARRTVTARVRVGDGPSDMVFDGDRAWVMNHRDRALFSVDAASNRARRLAIVPGDAPERIARAAGSLWVTGRGTDLIRLDPATGAVRATVEIGAGGIDVVAAGGALWVPARAAAADVRGFPTMAALMRVDPALGRATTVVRARGRVDVHGLVPSGRAVLLADNTSGRLYAVG